jgi:hypothetical protein
MIPYARGFSQARFAIVITTLIALKLWLVQAEDIIGSATQYDALWYVRSASHWYWYAPYSWTAFMRPCAYPLWIAVIHLLHVPLRLAIELLQVGGAVVLLIALRRIGTDRWISSVCFAAICFHPAGFQLNDYTMSDTLYAAILWYVLGGLLLTTGTRRAWIAAGTGVAIAILWNTREEGLLIVAMVAIWSAISFAHERSHGSSTRLTLARITKPIVVTCAVAAMAIIGVYTTNYFVYRSFARSEMTARSFQSLFHGLLRIRPSEPKRYVPITSDTLHRAFKVSSTFAKLRTQFDGPLGEAWRIETYRRVGVPNEIGVGWIVWATRQAASAVGVFDTAKKSQRLFKKAAREINSACDDGRLPTRFVVDGFLDPLAQSGGLSRLPNSIVRVGVRFFTRWPINSIGDDEILTPAEASLYDEMTLRRSAGVPQRTGLAVSLENLIGRYHFVAVILLHLLVVVALASFAIARRRAGGSAGYGAAIFLLGSAVFLRVVLLAWLDATAFDATGDRFLFPVLPLWTVVLVLTVGHAVVRGGRSFHYFRRTRSTLNAERRQRLRGWRSTRQMFAVVGR